LGLHLTPETHRLVQVALAEGALARLSGERLREELALLFDLVEHLPRTVERLEELGILRNLHPALHRDDRLRSRLPAVVAVHSWWRLSGLSLGRQEPWLLSLFALAGDLDGGARTELADRLGLAGERRERLVGLRERTATAARALAAAESSAPHRLTEQLAPLPIEELLLLMAEAPEAGQSTVRRFLAEWRRFRPRLRGRDLVAAGWPPGPAIGEALHAVWAARLDGQIAESEEFDLAASRLGRRRPESSPPGVGEEP
jgi:tRNA nucleotidyltransferase/poly(A) polymerase